MGGGVGKVISDLATDDTKNNHSIIILEKPKKTHFMEKCIKSGIDVKVAPLQEETENFLCFADIVILHWWNHPLMYEFLSVFPTCNVRLILWCHISGCTYPFLPYNFLKKFHKVFFTSQCSYHNKYWSHAQREEMQKKATLVYGLGKLEHMQPKKNYSAKGEIIVGYLGTLTKSKLHPQFVNACYNILQQNSQIKFVLVGDKKTGQWIEDESRKLGIAERIELKGYCQNVNECLLEFDIFGYPLNPYHFGTTENSILEAMSAGLPVILMNQRTEQYIIDNDIDGLLSDDLTQYEKNILFLSKSENDRKRIGKQAAQNVHIKFDFSKNRQQFNDVVEQVLHMRATPVCFSNAIGSVAFDWFMHGLNEDDKTYFEHIMCETDESKKTDAINKCPDIFLEKTKSSIPHFVFCYPKDKKLVSLKNIFSIGTAHDKTI